MNINVRKLYLASAFVVNNEEDRVPSQSVGEFRIIPLIKCPSALEILWTEYEFGLNEPNQPKRSPRMKEESSNTVVL